jgi:hypothetical protein
LLTHVHLVTGPTLGGRIEQVNWRTFAPSNFEYDFENDKLFQHRVTFNEAVECFFSDFEIRRNKKYRDRYQLSYPAGRSAEQRSRLSSN